MSENQQKKKGSKNAYKDMVLTQKEHIAQSALSSTSRDLSFFRENSALEYSVYKTLGRKDKNTQKCMQKKTQVHYMKYTVIT